MKFSKIHEVCPAEIPVASIPYRDRVLDIFAPTGLDVLWLISRSKDIEAAMNMDGVSALDGLLDAVGNSGPEIRNRLLSIALAEDEEVFEKVRFTFEEEKEIIKTMFEFGIPDDLRGKFMTVVGIWMANTAKKLEAEAETMESEASSLRSSSSSDRKVTTPTK